MQKLLLFVDKVSTFVGQTFSWLIVGLTLLITWEVYSRYALDHPHAWAFDVMIMLYGTLFMMAGAYTLSKNSHVRGDVLYGFFPPRMQAGLDLALYFVFFIPGVLAFVWAGYTYAGESWAINEHSNITSEGPADLSVQDGHPGRRGADPDAGHRRDHPLHHLPEAGQLALTRRGRGGSGRRQAEGRWSTSRTRTSRSSTTSWWNRNRKRPANEEGSLVRAVDHGAGRDPGVRADAAAVADDQRPPRAC